MIAYVAFHSLLLTQIPYRHVNVNMQYMVTTYGLTDHMNQIRIISLVSQDNNPYICNRFERFMLSIEPATPRQEARRSINSEPLPMQPAEIGDIR
jgi:hypothetical protein